MHYTVEPKLLGPKRKLFLKNFLLAKKLLNYKNYNISERKLRELSKVYTTDDILR